MYKTKIAEFKEFAFNRHDVYCNQKYNDDLPYSFHLKMVLVQCDRFAYLLKTPEEYYIAACGCIGHDLIEDARMTYNDIVNITNKAVADVIYCCTEDKGKNRAERHSEKFYTELNNNRIAVFDKLCDVIANVKFSLLTNSSMYDKYKKEFDNLYEHLKSHTEFEPMFKYLQKLLEVNE